MNRKKIGKCLRKLRGHKPASKVAKACGVSVSAIYMYESGDRIPKDDIKIRLASYYNKSLHKIFFE